MKISPVNAQNQAFQATKKSKKHVNNKQQKQQNSHKNLIDLNKIGQNLPAFNVKLKSKDDYTDLRVMKRNFTPEAKQIYDYAISIAKAANSPELETWHTYMASLIMANNFIKEVDKNPILLDQEQRFRLPYAIQNLIYMGCTCLYVDEKRKQVIEILDKHIKSMEENFVQRDLRNNPRPQLTTPTMSKKSICDTSDFWNKIIQKTDMPDFFDSYFLLASHISQDKQLAQEYDDLVFDLQEAIMKEEAKANEKNHIEFYDNKADTMWKNIALGNNILIINDNENLSGYSYLASSFANLVKKPGQNYGNIDPKRTHVIKLSDKATKEFVYTLAKKTKYDPNKKGETTVIMFDMDALLQNSEMQIPLEFVRLLSQSEKYNPDKSNVYYALSVAPESYHINTETPGPMRDLLTGFAQQSLPILTATDAKNYLANESGVKFISSKIKKDVQPQAVLRAIELTGSRQGNYPDKAIELLSTVSKYFVDEKEITPKHVDTYLKETENLSEIANVEERSIIFDTGKTLADIKGMPMVLAQAQSYVKQIQNGSIGTRGIIIMHNHGGASGGGRRHTIEAIAGETQVPILKLNARDFAIKDIDALSQEAGLSEIKIKKIIQNAKAQAEANPLNTAIIYIDNFDSFGSDPLYGISSIYEQKAFSQLLSEMEAIRKEGKLNIVVVGSMNIPETLDENILKPYKFLNQIVIYQPRNTKQRREILDYYIKKDGRQIKDSDSGEKDKILNTVAERTKYFSVVDLIDLLDRANIISKEQDKGAIDTTDFTEAYLQMTTGRADTSEISDARKKIVTSHEAGHALTLQLMYEMAEKSDIPWHLPSKVDFITLDPRGDFGGAMFYKDSENEEWSFERVFADIICSYGGHSAENIIYNMQGSWGITGDMESAVTTAEQMVTLMGMGAKTGVRNTIGNRFATEKQKEAIQEDVSRLLATAKDISDSIIKAYQPFILEFTEKYYQKVATGECLIPSEEFQFMLNDWRSKQAPQKRKELEKLEFEISQKINRCKKGE